MGALTGPSHPVAVMDLRRAINAEANFDLIPAKQFAPFPRQEGAVGLDGVMHADAGGGAPGQEGKRVFVKLQAGRRWLARVPVEGNCAAGNTAREDKVRACPQDFVGH